MAAKFPSAASCKVVLVVVAVAMIGLILFSTTTAGAMEAVTTTVADAQCNFMVDISPDKCDTWCKNHGHPGGYPKRDQCCCNSGGGGGNLAAES